MPAPTAFVHATATRWISDEPVPGLVEVALQDADDKVWQFVDKAPMFDESDLLNRDSMFPVGIEIACTVLARRVHDGRHLVQISTASPWGLEAIDGTHVFEVPAAQLRDSD